MQDKRKVLIIEDEPDLSDLLRARFNSEGFEVFVANDGFEGLAQARLIKPDIIILDLMLPRLSGEEVCREIRKDKIIGRMPIIMLTAKTSDADRIVGRVIGADCYLTKPFDAGELINEVNRILNAVSKNGK